MKGKRATPNPKGEFTADQLQDLERRVPDAVGGGRGWMASHNKDRFPQQREAIAQ